MVCLSHPAIVEKPTVMEGVFCLNNIVVHFQVIHILLIQLLSNINDIIKEQIYG